MSSCNNNSISTACNRSDFDLLICHLSDYSTTSARPSLAWDGSNYLLSWTEQDYSSLQSQVHYKTIYGQHALSISADIPLFDTSFNSHSDLQWNGSEIAIIWTDSNCPLGACNTLSILDRQGDFIHSWPDDTYLPPGDPNLLWTGANYCLSILAFGGYYPGVNFVLFSTDVSSFSPPLTLANDIYSSGPQVGLTWSGSEYAITWHQIPGSIATDLFFARIDTTGSVIGVPVQLTSMNWSYGPQIAWSGSEYGIAWISKRGPEVSNISFLAVNPTGSAISRISYGTGTDAWNPTITWTGSTFAIIWVDGPIGNQQLLLNTITNDNEFNDTTRQIGDCNSAIIHPDAVLANHSLGVVWAENANDQEICFEDTMHPDSDYPRCDMDILLGIIDL